MLLALALLGHSLQQIEASPAFVAVIHGLEGDPLIALLLAALLTWACHSSVAVVLLVASWPRPDWSRCPSPWPWCSVPTSAAPCRRWGWPVAGGAAPAVGQPAGAPARLPAGAALADGAGATGQRTRRCGGGLVPVLSTWPWHCWRSASPDPCGAARAPVAGRGTVRRAGHAALPRRSRAGGGQHRPGQRYSRSPAAGRHGQSDAARHQRPVAATGGEGGGGNPSPGPGPRPVECGDPRLPGRPRPGRPRRQRRRSCPGNPSVRHQHRAHRRSRRQQPAAPGDALGRAQSRRQRSSSLGRMLPLQAAIEESLHLAISAFLREDLDAALRLVARKKLLQRLEADASRERFRRLRDDRGAWVESGDVFQRILRDYRRIHHHVTAWPIRCSNAAASIRWRSGRTSQGREDRHALLICAGRHFGRRTPAPGARPVPRPAGRGRALVPRAWRGFARLRLSGAQWQRQRPARVWRGRPRRGRAGPGAGVSRWAPGQRTGTGRARCRRPADARLSSAVGALSGEPAIAAGQAPAVGGQDQPAQQHEGEERQP